MAFLALGEAECALHSVRLLENLPHSRLVSRLLHFHEHVEPAGVSEHKIHHPGRDGREENTRFRAKASI